MTQLRTFVPSKELLQPNAATQYKDNTDFDLDWPGLTVIHQKAHTRDNTIFGGDESNEMILGNAHADKLCTTALKEIHDYEVHQTP